MAYAIGPSEDCVYLFENILRFKKRKLAVYMKQLTKDEFATLKQNKAKMGPIALDMMK